MAEDDHAAMDRLIAEGKVTPALFNLDNLLAIEPIVLPSGKTPEQLVREDRDSRY